MAQSSAKLLWRPPEVAKQSAILTFPKGRCAQIVYRDYRVPLRLPLKGSIRVLWGLGYIRVHVPNSIYFGPNVPS